MAKPHMPLEERKGHGTHTLPNGKVLEFTFTWVGVRLTEMTVRCDGGCAPSHIRNAPLGRIEYLARRANLCG